MHKMADGLLSGRYSVPRQHPDPASVVPEDPVFQEGIKPAGFKSLIGKGHEEFATMRQQDSEEFLGHLLKTLRAHSRKTHGAEVVNRREEPTEIFTFGTEQRLACSECHGVRYRVDESDTASVPIQATEKAKEGDKVEYEDISLLSCIEALMGTEELEYNCPSCSKSVKATK